MIRETARGEREKKKVKKQEMKLESDKWCEK